VIGDADRKPDPRIDLGRARHPVDVLRVVAREVPVEARHVREREHARRLRLTKPV